MWFSERKRGEAMAWGPDTVPVSLQHQYLLWLSSPFQHSWLMPPSYNHHRPLWRPRKKTTKICNVPHKVPVCASFNPVLFLDTVLIQDCLTVERGRDRASLTVISSETISSLMNHILLWDSVPLSSLSTTQNPSFPVQAKLLVF